MRDSLKHIPQWFIAGFAVVYLSGYLIEFFFYSSIGVFDAENDALKFKYIQVGISFILTFVLLGAPGFFLFMARRRLAEEVAESNDVFRYMTSAIGTAQVVLFLFSLTCSALFTPTHFFREGSARFWALAIEIAACILGYIIAISLIETIIPKDDMKKRDRYIQILGAILIAIILICDLWIFDHVWNVFYDLIYHEGYFYAIFTGAFFLTAYRLVTRLPKPEAGPFNVGAYAALSGLSLLVLFYLAVWTYAYTVFPFIPYSKGGADYTYSPRINVEVTISTLTGSTKVLTNQILLYDNGDTLFLGKITRGDDACGWRDRTALPVVIQLQKSSIASSEVHQLGPSEKNCYR
jgi:thiamine transporter ThiT